MRGRSTVMAAGLLVFIASCAHQHAATAQHPVTLGAPPSAPVAAVDSRVGALFIGDKSMHACSGSVLNSATGDLVLTAAHCLTSGVDSYFVPGYDRNAAADDYWRIDAVYLDPRWMADQDPLADFAIARVSRDHGGTLEKQAGGGFAIGAAPRGGTEVTVTGYALGVGGAQLACRARTGTLRGYPSLPCAGFVDGTSGAPWVSGSTVTGVIGGLDGGGCQDDVSYSPPFDGAVRQLLARAEAGGPADAAPAAYAIEC